MFEVNDRVELTAARGGWDGYVARVLTAADGGPLYEIRSPEQGNRAQGTQLVRAVDVAGGLTATTFAVGDQVAIAGRGGEVVADNGDGTYEVDVQVTYNRHLTLTRRHTVPLWLLAVENGR